MIEKKIFVCCGIGIVMLVQVVNKFQWLLCECGINVWMEYCCVVEVLWVVERFSFDVIVLMIVVKQFIENVKMFCGVVFFIGVDEGQLVDEIVNVLKL